MDLDTQFHTDFDRDHEAELDEGWFGPLMQRAIGEQIAEQRLIREALTDFDRRLEMLERTVADRLVLVEREASARVDRFERSVAERMLAFETVLKRIVDRLTGTEERIVEAVDHGAQVTRTMLDAFRPTVEGAVDRVAAAAEESEEAVTAAVAKAESRIESTVREVTDAELRAAIDEFRSLLGAAERKIRRDVNRRTLAEAPGNGRPSMDADRVEAPDAGDTGPRRRRPRPLRAREG